ncbi:MAG: response regulator [Sandaracinaceae bacterium]|nr:response regulator [Sandaracinaceae bacterium]
MSQRVLVVDDSATVRRVVGRTLGQAGYEVSLAADGREALDRAQAQVPDLVLVDFVMPHMNGLRFVQAMRQVANLAHVPVVLMSAKADKIGDGFVAQTGALDAITKPFSPEALLAVTGHALSRAAERSTERDTPPLSLRRRAHQQRAAALLRGAARDLAGRARRRRAHDRGDPRPRPRRAARGAGPRGARGRDRRALRARGALRAGQRDRRARPGARRGRWRSRRASSTCRSGTRCRC